MARDTVYPKPLEGPEYYLYINKLAPKDLSLDEFKARISWRYDFEKLLPSIS